MKIKFTGQFNANPRMIMRNCGYAEIRDRRTMQTSYALRLGREHYPRFHAYIDIIDGGFQVNLHIDQKKASYEGQTAHSGEYEGEKVEAEGGRIGRWVESMKVS
jgi:hypothetical protein